MKKLLGILVILLALTGCSSLILGDSVNFVTPDKIIEKFDKGETFAFVIGDATCGFCKQYRETTLEEFKKEKDIELDYIDLNILTKSETDDAIKLVNEENYLNGDFSATPTTYFVVEGKVVKVLAGAVGYDKLAEGYKLVEITTESE